MALELASLADFCYKESSNLLLGRYTLSSTRGVEQGDLLGPARFVITICDIIVQVKDRTASFYLAAE